MIRATWCVLLTACGGTRGGVVDDWRGGWEGTFDGSLDGETWPMRMIDLEDWGITDEAEDGRAGWREWRGTFEVQAGDDHRVAPIQLYSCEEDACTGGDGSSAQHDVFMLTYATVGAFVCSGAIQGDTVACDGQLLRPGRPSIGPVFWERAEGRLRVGDL